MAIVVNVINESDEIIGPGHAVVWIDSIVEIRDLVAGPGNIHFNVEERLICPLKLQSLIEV